MDKRIDEIIREIKAIFPSDEALSMELTKLPRNVSLFVNDDREVLFVFKKAPTARSVLPYYNSRYPQDPNVSGEPLEDILQGSLCINESKIFINPEHIPLQPDVARSIISYYNLKFKKSTPIWILCGSETEQIKLLGSRKYLNDSFWIENSWANYKGLSSNNINLEELLKSHKDLSKIKSRLPDVEMTSFYKIQPVMSSDNCSVIYREMNFNISWNKLCLDPPLDSKTEVHLNIKCNVFAGSGSFALFWKQIALIENYLKLIEDINETRDLSEDLPSTFDILKLVQSKDVGVNLKNKLSKLLAEPEIIHMKNVEQSTTVKLIEDLDNIKMSNLDFTDKLWYLLLECHKYSELTTLLKQLILNVELTKNVFVNVTNISRLADILRKKIGANIFESSDLLKLFVEIGLERLRKVAVSFKSKLNLFTYDNDELLKKRFKDVNDNEWISTVSQWTTWLCRIHCAMELITGVTSTVSLSNNTVHLIIRSVADQCLKDKFNHIENFDWLSKNEIQEITIRVPVQDVPREAKHFDYWLLTLMSKTSKREFTSKYYNGYSNPFNNYHNLDATFLCDTTAIDLSPDHIYHSVEFHSVKTKLG